MGFLITLHLQYQPIDNIPKHWLTGDIATTLLIQINNVQTVRDEGLHGSSDQHLYDVCRFEQRCLVTLDVASHRQNCYFISNLKTHEII